MHARSAQAGRRQGDTRLLEHLRSLETLAAERPPASERLERALGPELARRLVSALTRAGAQVEVAA